MNSNEVKKVAPVDEVDGNGWTALRSAASCGNTDKVRILLEQGADIYSGENPGNAFYIAVSNNHLDTAKVILEHEKKTGLLSKPPLSTTGGSIVNRHNANKATPLIEACSLGNIEMVRFLLENGADIHATDYTGGCAIHGCCEQLHRRPENRKKIAQMLIDAGADINAYETSETGRKGWLPLELVNHQIKRTSELYFRLGEEEEERNAKSELVHLKAFRNFLISEGAISD